MDDLGNAAQVHINDISRQQAIVAVTNALYTISAHNRRTHDGADGGVHARGVAAAGQHADGFDFGCHGKTSLWILCLRVLTVNI